MRLHSACPMPPPGRRTASPSSPMAASRWESAPAVPPCGNSPAASGCHTGRPASGWRSSRTPSTYCANSTALTGTPRSSSPPAGPRPAHLAGDSRRHRHPGSRPAHPARNRRRHGPRPPRESRRSRRPHRTRTQRIRGRNDLPTAPPASDRHRRRHSHRRRLAQHPHRRHGDNDHRTPTSARRPRCSAATSRSTLRLCGTTGPSRRSTRRHLVQTVSSADFQ